MPSMIDPTHPAAGIAVSKAASRANWAAAKAELEHGGFFLAHSSAVERRTQDKLRELGVSVIDFGADPTGAADSTSAIQQAIDAVGAAGGGVVFMPAGDYKIMPQASVNADAAVAEAALFIRHDNVILKGAGISATKLVFYVNVGGQATPAGWRTAGGDARNGWEIKSADGSLHRGFGIKVEGTGNASVPRKNVHLLDFELDGNAYPGNQNDSSFPASPSTGSGWDVTHKGIILEDNEYHADMLLDRIHVHNFRGELVYHGGILSDRVTIRHCRAGASNANCYNIACANRLLFDCEAYDVHGAVSEDVTLGENRFIAIRARDCKHGITTGRFQNTWGRTLIIGCTLENIGQVAGSGNAIQVFGGDTVVADNVLTDCSDGIIIHAPPQGGIDWNLDRRNVLVQGNIFHARTSGKTHNLAIFVGGSDTVGHVSPARDVRITGNQCIATSPAIYTSFVQHALTAASERVVIDNNVCTGAQRFVRGDVVRAPMLGLGNVMDGDLGNEATAPTDTLAYPRIALNPASTFAEPTITASAYIKGHRVVLVGPWSNAPTYIPRRSNSFRCEADRYLYDADTELTMEFDGTRFVEVGWVDKRADAETTVASGTTLDAQGRDVVRLSFGSPTTVTAHQAVPEGLPITVYATNGNATLASNAAIAMTSGANLTLVANRPYRFIRLGTVLRQMD